MLRFTAVTIAADRAVAAAKILRHARDGEVRRAARRSCRPGSTRAASPRRARRTSGRCGNRPSSFAAPRIVVGCERNGVAVRARELRRAADAAAVVKPLAAAVHLAAVDVEAEQSAAGDEERPPLVEERLVRREVEHRRIGFDLPEVRVDRRVEREVRRDAILEIAAERDVATCCREAVVGDLATRSSSRRTASPRAGAAPRDRRALRARRTATRSPVFDWLSSGQLTRSL